MSPLPPSLTLGFAGRGHWRDTARGKTFSSRFQWSHLSCSCSHGFQHCSEEPSALTFRFLLISTGQFPLPGLVLQYNGPRDPWFHLPLFHFPMVNSGLQTLSESSRKSQFIIFKSWAVLNTVMKCCRIVPVLTQM
jgi:hypothetical protein